LFPGFFLYFNLFVGVVALVRARFIDDFALFFEKPYKQLVGLGGGDLWVIFENSNQLVQILCKRFQFYRALRLTHAEPAFGFSLVPLLNVFRNPRKALFIKTLDEMVNGFLKQIQSAAGANIGYDMG